MNQSVIDANIEVHTRMAASYNSSEPHFRPENQAKVHQRLAEVRNRAPGGRMLDLGCGTGFLIRLADDLFDEIHGVDITQAMLDEVDVTSGRVFVRRSIAETVPFDDASFDVVTAYSFIHHTADYSLVLKEAFRVLKPGGMLYIDLEPNKRFWIAIDEVAGRQITDLSPIVQREVDSVLHTDEQVERDYGIPQETFRQAEFTKAILGGIDPDELHAACVDAGFTECSVRPDWFLGQGAVMHGQSFEAADTVDEYLRQLGPLGMPLYKYLWCVCRK